MIQKKFLNQPNLRLKLKKVPEGNPRMDVEDLPKQTYEDCSKLFSELRQVDAEISESFLSKR